jgi:hypothetical protein
MGEGSQQRLDNGESAKLHLARKVLQLNWQIEDKEPMSFGQLKASYIKHAASIGAGSSYLCICKIFWQLKVQVQQRQINGKKYRRGNSSKF